MGRHEGWSAASRLGGLSQDLWARPHPENNLWLPVSWVFKSFRSWVCESVSALGWGQWLREKGTFKRGLSNAQFPAGSPDPARLPRTLAVTHLQGEGGQAQLSAKWRDGPRGLARSRSGEISAGPLPTLPQWHGERSSLPSFRGDGLAEELKGPRTSPAARGVGAVPGRLGHLLPGLAVQGATPGSERCRRLSSQHPKVHQAA